MREIDSFGVAREVVLPGENFHILVTYVKASFKIQWLKVAGSLEGIEGLDRRW